MSYVPKSQRETAGDLCVVCGEPSKMTITTDGETKHYCDEHGKQESRKIFAEAYGITCKDILQKLKETNQIYIVGHDIPLSISKHLFNMLDARRKQEAAKRKIPEEQYEFEDIIGLFLGLGK